MKTVIRKQTLWLTCQGQCITMHCKRIQMQTQFTVRLPSDLNNKVHERARRLRLKRSDIIRLALAEFLEGPEDTEYSFDKIKHLAGSFQSGVSDLGTNHRKYLIQKIRQSAKRTS